MSKSETDPQTDLSEFQTAAEIAEEGYDKPEWTPMADDEEEKDDCCQNCGNSVTLQFRRVFGDNDNVVHGCPDCSTYRELKDGAHLDGGHQ